jgi:hypothetical protein
VTTKRRIGVEGWEDNQPRSKHSGQGERLQKGENETRRWESEIRLRVISRVGSPSCAVQSRNGTVVGAYLAALARSAKWTRMV